MLLNSVTVVSQLVGNVVRLIVHLFQGLIPLVSAFHRHHQRRGPGASRGSSATIFLAKTSMSQKSRNESSEPPVFSQRVPRCPEPNLPLFLPVMEFYRALALVTFMYKPGKIVTKCTNIYKHLRTRFVQALTVSSF